MEALVAIIIGLGSYTGLFYLGNMIVSFHNNFIFRRYKHTDQKAKKIVGIVFSFLAGLGTTVISVILLRIYFLLFPIIWAGTRPGDGYRWVYDPGPLAIFFISIGILSLPMISVFQIAKYFYSLFREKDLLYFTLFLLILSIVAVLYGFVFLERLSDTTKAIIASLYLIVAIIVGFQGIKHGRKKFIAEQLVDKTSNALGASKTGELKTHLSIKTLIKALSHNEDGNVRRNAAEQLGKIKHERAVKPLIKANPAVTRRVRRN